MRMLRRELRILMFILGTTGLLAPFLPAAAQSIEDAVSVADESVVMDTMTDETLDARAEGASISSASSVIGLTTSAERADTLSEVSFHAEASEDASISIAEYAWDLDGDGAFEHATADPWIQHTYDQDGVFEVRVLAISDTGETFTSAPLRVEIVNRPPSASFEWSEGKPTDSEPIQFLSRSSDQDGQVVAWFWNLGDGSTSTLENPVHEYAEAGTYFVTLLVIDDDGRASAAESLSVTVENAPPVASFSGPSTVISGAAIQFTDTSLDPSPGGRIVHVAWDFGDGIYFAGGPSASGAYSHTYSEPGLYSVTLFVIDKDGILSTARSQVRVLGAL